VPQDSLNAAQGYSLVVWDGGRQMADGMISERRHPDPAKEPFHIFLLRFVRFLLIIFFNSSPFMPHLFWG
jgi:hypothetical protein